MLPLERNIYNNNVDLIKVNIDQHQIDSDLKLTQKQNPNPKVREQVIALKRFLYLLGSIFHRNFTKKCVKYTTCVFAWYIQCTITQLN